MTTKRMTGKDYRKELHRLELETKALEKRIKIRAEELMKQNPDVHIQFPFYTRSYKASDIQFSKDVEADTMLIIIQAIETDIANKHPHKQTKIEFPKTQHEKIMDIAKGIQALNIPKRSKYHDDV